MEVVPSLEILLRGRESVGVEGPHTHAGLRKAGRVPVAPIRLLDVFAEGELDAADGAFEFQAFGGFAVAQLDGAILPADGIGRTMEQMRHGHASSQLLVNVLRFGIDDISDADHGGGRERAFVDAAENHAVTVAINDAGGDIQAGAVNEECIGIRLGLEIADGLDLAV